MIWFILLLSPFISEDKAITLNNAISKHCRYPKLAAAIAFKESSFRRLPMDELGDHGIMQINARYHGHFETLNKQVKAACSLLEHHYDPNDKCWFAKYHSKTPYLKRLYCKQIWSIINVRR